MVAAAVLLLAGCGVIPFATQSPRDLASGALQSWSKSPAIRFEGRLSAREGTVRFTVTETRDSRKGEGSGTLDGKPFTYLDASGNQYLKGQSFWQKYCVAGCAGFASAEQAAKGIGERWGRATVPQNPNDLPANDVASALHSLASLGGAVSDLHRDSFQLKKVGTRTIGGHHATQLQACRGCERFWVVQGNPDRLVGFDAEIAGRYLSNVHVTITSVKVPDATAPTPVQTVDPQDPSTLPALYRIAHNEAGRDCNVNSCVLPVGIQNEAGAPQGTSTVQITAAVGATEVGSCSATIPAIPSGGDQDVSCTITGAAWTAWASKAANTLLYVNTTGQITANPPYFG